MNASNQKNFFRFLANSPEIDRDLNDILDEPSREVVRQVINQNLSNDELRVFLDKNNDLKESQKKLVFKFWKVHGRTIMQMIEQPVSNNTQGIASVDWEVQ